jgi:enediyne biosynthesis protein E4
VANNRDGIGARVRIGNQMQTLSTADGYSSSVHAPVHVGLGALQRVESVEISWPNGKKQVVKNVTTNQVVVIKEQ